MTDTDNTTIRRISGNYLVKNVTINGISENIFDTYEKLDAYLKGIFGVIKVLKPEEVKQDMRELFQHGLPGPVKVELQSIYLILAKLQSEVETMVKKIAVLEEMAKEK